MATRPEECGYCNHDHPSNRFCEVSNCECSATDFELDEDEEGY